MRSNRRRGAILLLSLLFILVTLSLAAILVDLGGALMTKQQAIAASENAAMTGVTEFYAPDYAQLGNINNPNQWPAQLRQNEPRTSARLRAAEHEVGYTVQLLDRTGGPVGPASPELTVYFGASATYIPDVQINLTNNAAGDVLLGRWEKIPGGAYRFVAVQGAGQPAGFANLPRSMQVMIRRTELAEVPGVSEGNNPIPFLFRRAMWTGQTGVSPGVYRNRGDRLEIVNTISLLPVGRIGAGAVVPIQGGGVARVGVMPFVVVFRPNVPAWVINNDPNQTFRIDLDNRGGLGGGAEGFFTHYGLGPGQPFTIIQNILNFLEGMNPGVAPPSLALDDQVPRPPLTRQEETALANRLEPEFEQETWILPAVDQVTPNNFRIVGFLRVYGVAIRGRNRIDVRLAPSAATRASIPLRGTIPAGIAQDFFDTFWLTVDGQRVGPRPFGIACAVATVRYGHVKK